ncbi:MAG: VCBS repeat-containing protein [Saprospiraceae bacterium]|nr:VCBS repeat-containing protein [Saprospiraceae bacterium]
MKTIRLFTTSTALLFLTQGLFAQTFTDRTNLLFQPNSFSSGGAVGVTDINNDGKDDIVRLDEGNSVNVEYQAGANQAFQHYSFGTYDQSAWALTVGDVNNDGFCDLFFAGYKDGAKLLLANNNGFGFSPGLLPGSAYFAQGSNFADINNDGWLDVFSCDDDAESRIWGNNGAGGFAAADHWINMATVPVSDNSGNYGSTWTDFDNDGDLDLYIAKCRGGASSPTDPRRINQLFVNDGNGHYHEAAGAYGLKIGWQSWTSDFQDIDNDGDLDCFITNHDYNSQLLRNDGTGHFTDISAAAGFGNVMDGFIQGIMRDFDNDGYMDVLTASNGRLFHNNGNGTFTSVSVPFSSMNSMAVGDLNHDGFLDIFAIYQCGYISDCGNPDKLWMNNGNANHYLAVQLQGNQSNRKGVGARVELHGAWGKQVREIRSGESYGISNSLTAHFGLGAATQVDYLVVHWPSGTVDVVANPAPDQYLNIVEGSTNFCGSLAINATPTAATAPPDVVGSNLSIACANASVQVEFTLCNEGASSLPSGLPLALYQNDPRLPGASLLEVVWYDYPAVPVNGCIQLDFQLPANQLPDLGNHEIYLVANDDGTSVLPLATSPGSFIAECNLANNFTSTSFTLYPPPSLNLGPDLDLCNVANVQLSAGNVFAAYQWQGSETGASITASQTGLYWVLATDVCGMQQVDSVQVALSYAAPINLGDDLIICAGETIPLSIATAGYTAAEWQPSGLVGCPGCLQTSATPLQSTTISVTATNGACVGSDALQVTVVQPPSLSLSQEDGSCGQPVSITAIATGNGPFSYTWSFPNGTSGQNAATIYPNQTGNYSVTVSDANGCEATTSAQATLYPVTEFYASTTAPSCANSTDGSIDITVASGFGPFTYLWSNQATTEDLTGIAGGTYIVTITNANQCTSLMAVEVDGPPAFTADHTYDLLLCNGQTGYASVEPMGGIPGYSYLWSNGATTREILSLPAGNYTVTITDAANCTATTSFELTQPPALEVVVSASEISCANGQPGQVVANVTGGSLPYVNYFWSNGGMGQTLAIGSPGLYSVTVMDTYGCQATGSATADLSGALDITAMQTPISCHPSNGNGADGSIALTVTSGSGSYAYLWENGDTTSIRTGLAAGSYSVTVTDGSGCQGTAMVVLEQPTQLIALATFLGGSCDGQANGSATASASGGTPPYVFNWGSLQQVGPVATGLVAGIYTVTATDAHGCSDSDEVLIPLLQNDTTNMELSFCQGESSPLTGIAYPDPGDFTEQLVLSNYQGCDSVVVAEVTVHPEEWIWADNGPLPYGMEYHGVILTQDTQFILFDTTEFGCLLTISENVTVFPLATHEPNTALGLLAYPNPFTDHLHLRFTLPRPMAVSISLYDALGREVRALVVEQQMGAGEHVMGWEEKGLAPGVYLVRVWADGLEGGRKVVRE